jgi:hypothetical protein
MNEVTNDAATKHDAAITMNFILSIDNYDCHYSVIRAFLGLFSLAAASHRRTSSTGIAFPERVTAIIKLCFFFDHKLIIMAQYLILIPINYKRET